MNEQEALALDVLHLHDTLSALGEKTGDALSKLEQRINALETESAVTKLDERVSELEHKVNDMGNDIHRIDYGNGAHIHVHR